MALLFAALLTLAFPVLAGVVIAGNVLLFIACVLDRIGTPDPNRLDVRRSVPDRAGLSQPFTRTVRIDASALRGAGGRRLELHEEFAALLRVRERTVLDPSRKDAVPVPDGALGRALPRKGDPSAGPDQVVLPRNGPIDLARVYSCHVRGVFGVGDMRVRLTGPLGLLMRQRRLFGEQIVHIEPALTGLKRTLELAASERWQDLGVRFLRRKGGVTEFESMREYVHGDDTRSLDWKAFAKRGRPIVREYQEERGQELILLVDCGRRMAATTAEGDVRGWTKLDHALDAALQLAAVALGRGDRVGMATFDTDLHEFVQPVRGRGQFARLRQSVYARQPSGVESSLKRALQTLGARHRRRAMVVILSDVADPLSTPAQRRALAGASRRHKLVFCALDDPGVRQAAQGDREVTASERAAACFQVEERQLGLAELRGSHARVLDALPAEAALPLLAAWLEARRAG